MPKHTLLRASSHARKIGLLIQAAVLVSAGLVPLTFGSSALAASTQLSNRSVSTTTAIPGAATTLTFQFDTTDKGASTNVKQIEIEFCDTPLAACAHSNTPTLPGSPSATMTGWGGSGVTTTTEDGRTAGASSGNQIKIVYTTPANENNKTGLQIEISGFTNKNTANLSYYPRIRLYSDTGTTLEWYGAVAQSTSQTLTVNARVQEILSFCVGSTTVDDITTQVAADCSGVTGTSVDLGVVSSGAVSVTPVSATNGGDARNAVAMVQTNAVNGVAISYKAVQETSSGALKVVGAACSGTTVTDQCFNSAGVAQTAFVAGTEKFGMTVAGINCASVPGTAYTCNYAVGQTNLQPQTNYIGSAGYTYSSTGAGSGTYTPSNNTGQGFAWDDGGVTARTIASSATSATKVVANEAIMLKFAATAGITTPTGQYQTQADFIATPTY